MNKNINFSIIDIDKFIDEHMMFTNDEELLKKEKEIRDKELAEHKKDYEDFLEDIRTGKVVL